MLHRASKHSTKLDGLRYWQKSLDALYLPWLCPSLYASRRSGSRQTSTAATPRLSTHPAPNLSLSTKKNAHGSKRIRRGLASAVTASYDTSQDHYIPFEALDISSRTQADFDRRWLPPVTPAFDPDSALIINDSVTTKPPRFRAVNAISGEVEEIRQTIRACIQVDRLGRAATLMRRLNEIYKPDAPELVAAHNDFLRELVHKIRHSKDPQVLRLIHKWFEVDLRKIRVVPDAVTYALMIQAGLQESSPKRVDRTVKRYMFLADQAGIRDNVMQVILLMSGEQNTGRITEIAPIQSISTTVATYQFEDSAEYGDGVVSIPSTKQSVIPEIKTTPTKGLGMATLKTALSTLSHQPPLPPDKVDATTEAEILQARAIKRQQQLELNTYELAIDRWRTETKKLSSLGINIALKTGPISGLIWTWHEALVGLIKEEIIQANRAENVTPKKPVDVERCLYGPFLQILPVEKLSAITILSCMNHLCLHGPSHVGVSLSGLLRALGTAVADECVAETIRKDGDHRLWQSLGTNERVQKMNRMVKMRRIDLSSAKDFDPRSPSDERCEGLKWTDATKVKVGAVLVSHLVQTARLGVSSKDPTSGAEIRESQPAFVHSFTYIKGNRVGVLRFNKAMAHKLAEDPVSCTMAKYLPMVVEPKPWVGYRKGAFLQHPARVVRAHAGDLHSKRYAKIASENGDMDVVFSSLDALARTPWRINRALFDVMVAGWNSGKELGKIPPAQPDFPCPAEPSPDEGVQARIHWHRLNRDIENKRAGIHSNRCFQNFQLEVARAYLNEVFYFPHNVDFRGRAYPMVPFFNHIGADPVRSLLIFANGKELGEKGLRWIKIHLASLYGLTKATFEDRVKFTEDHLSEVFDSATRPLDGNQWWLRADDPWQCLGACMELKRALESPDPRRFVSHLPVHQDGTCNGLQHYAALGGDTLGAKQVNLAPGDRPADIYNTIADMVRTEITAEAAKGDELAKLLAHSITRKVVKQTVMTNVYGVTFIGASRQVRRQLDNSGIPFSDRKTMTTACVMIAKKIFEALSTMFFGATEIQHWLTDCAGRISRAVTPEQILTLRKTSDANDKETSSLARVALNATKSNAKFKDDSLFTSAVIWTTPLKMPVVQPYRENVKRCVTTNLQKITISSPCVTDPCHRRRQLQAFPPNFIHSLDASHMMLTALKCNEMGLTFASVHDSFWTHASDIDTMSEILREAFVRMHSEDIIGRLRSEFMVRYKGCMQLVKIPTTSDVANKISKWRRTKHHGTVNKRISKTEELVLEARRLELLESDKPEERLEGQTMVTAGKIYSESPEECHTEVSARSHLLSEEDIALAEEMPEQLAHDDLMSDMKTFGVNETEEEDIVEPSPRLSTESATRTTWLWVPITFPPVPKKGDFDISEIKKSKYFFC